MQSINIKKYTKDQMAKMVEDAAERLKSQEKENEELAEQLKSQTAKTIALRNDLMAKMHSNAVLTEKLDQMNGEAINKANEIANLKADLDAANAASKLLNDQGQQYWRAWQASKREVTDLKTTLADTEAALGRANAELTRSVIENKQLWDERVKLMNRAAVECERADYAESHPWRNLWKWIEKQLKMA